MKDDQLHASRRRCLGQVLLGAVGRPGSGQVAAVFVAVRVADHDLLAVAARAHRARDSAGLASMRRRIWPQSCSSEMVSNSGTTSRRRSSSRRPGPPRAPAPARPARRSAARLIDTTHVCEPVAPFSRCTSPWPGTSRALRGWLARALRPACQMAHRTSSCSSSTRMRSASASPR